MEKILKSGFGHGGIIERTLRKDPIPSRLIPPSIQDEEEKWMSLALLEAMKGIGWAAPNPSVGCVMVLNGNVVARGFTQSYGGKHAERMAFESFQDPSSFDGLSGIHVYVTLEPCTHYGKQPPCIDLILHPAIEKVVIGCTDPDPRVSGEGIRLLENSDKIVKVGVLENEIRAWHFPFLHHREKQKPLWVGKWAENQDGLLADRNGFSQWITGKESRAYSHWLRQKYDAVLVGAGTWIQDRPQLNVRDCAEPHHRHPVILIHDPKGKINPSDLPSGIHHFPHGSIEELVQAIEASNFGFELQSVFCEGGARTLSELFRLGKINLVHRFIGQKDFQEEGVNSSHRISGFNPDESGTWSCSTLCRFGNDLLQEWVNCS